MSSDVLRSLKDYYENKFFLRKFGNVTHAEYDSLLLYELDIEMRLAANFQKIESGN